MKEYRNYIFDLYGTLVDIDVDETDRKLWEHMCRFYGYYGALYEADELRRAYSLSVQDRNDQVKKEYAVKYRQESQPEILYEEVFGGLFADKGMVPDQQQKSCWKHCGPPERRSICCPMRSVFLRNMRCAVWESGICLTVYRFLPIMDVRSRMKDSSGSCWNVSR